MPADVEGKDEGWLGGVATASTTGRSMRTIDWTATSLGDPETWPFELRTIVQVCLSSRFPILVAWGPELRMIYNDGYRDMIGTKHPSALGAPMIEVWAELWDVIGPLIDGVLETGEPVWSELERFDMERHGFMEETYFTFSYSPLFDQSGAVRGIIDISTETTPQVLAQRRLECLSDLGTALLDAARVTDVCVRATRVLSQWNEDIVEADVFLRVGDEPVLISSTRQVERVPVDIDVLAAVMTERAPRRFGPDVDRADLPIEGIAVPLSGGPHGPEGVLYVEPSGRLPFTPEYARFVESIASTVGSVLENSYRRAEELGEQRRISDALQAAMLRPASDHPTVAARYRPAALNLAVGGDWYDVIDLDEHRRALVVGDCVGHGLEAATTMAQLRSAARAHLLEGHSPAAVLGSLDVFAASTPGAFATSVVCVVIDRKAATVTYSRAGHPPPLIADADELKWLDSAGDPPLQVELGRDRAEATTDYRDGSLLLLYTDGLIERRGEDLGIGLDRLAAAAQRSVDHDVGVSAVADDLLRDLLPRQRTDDVVLIVKRLVIDH